MTDEEKAEEYANACRGKIKDIHWQDVKYAVLYGLVEGRKEKWHNLEENPNDLPKESGEYWCKWEDGAYSTEHYFSDNGFGSYVIVWCELPKFKE